MKKQIFIHVGPPKTGTSALQMWLNENSNLLTSFGIFYPKHTFDSNGISSGNLAAIYSKEKLNNFVFDHLKTKELIEEFQHSNFSILLLSSEFFFKRMCEIKKNIPDAVFICYIRDPMEKRESLYNQGVKRHFFTELFPDNLGSKPISDLEVLQDFIDKFTSVGLVMRLYGKPYFKRGNIISDVLSILGVDLKPKGLLSINSSYTLEALEFKRWINNYDIADLNSVIDIALQKITNGTVQYSLIPPEIYEKQLNNDRARLRSFFSKNAVENSHHFLTDLNKKKQKEFKKQKLSPTNFRLICHYLYTEIPEKRIKLREKVILKEQTSDHEYKEIFLDVFRKKINLLETILNLLSFRTEEKMDGTQSNGLIQIRKNLNIDKSKDDAEILKEIALFAESQGNIDFSLNIMKMAQKRRPNGPLIKKKIQHYQARLSELKSNQDNNCGPK